MASIQGVHLALYRCAWRTGARRGIRRGIYDNTGSEPRGPNWMARVVRPDVTLERVELQLHRTSTNAAMIVSGGTALRSV
jgi:hypothetical protein